jgi:hypothetical protein
MTLVFVLSKPLGPAECYILSFVSTAKASRSSQVSKTPNVHPMRTGSKSTILKARL